MSMACTTDIEASLVLNIWFWSFVPKGLWAVAIDEDGRTFCLYCNHS